MLRTAHVLNVITIITIIREKVRNTLLQAFPKPKHVSRGTQRTWGFVPGGEGRGCLLPSLETTNSPYYYKAQTHKGSGAELPIQQANVKES